MNIRNSKLFFLEEDCIKQFGADKGKIIYNLSARRYEALCENADFQGNTEIEYHLIKNLYPTMAYYQALQEYGLSKEETLAFTRKETVRAATIKKAEQAKTATLPFAYFIYRLFVKSVMKKKFPSE